MKKLLSVFLLSFLFASSQILQAQDLEQVLKKHFEAVGQDRLLKVECMVSNATVMQMGMELPVVIKYKRPNKFRTEVNIQGQSIVQAFDGTDGWQIIPMVSPDPTDLVGEQLKQAAEQADIDGQLWNYKEKGSTVELTGKEDMEGTEVYHIKLTTKDSDVQNYYIDAETYLLLKVKSTLNIQGQEIEAENIMGNYRNFDGIVMPMSIESKAMGQSSQIVINTVDFNVTLEDSVFTRPVKKE